MQWVDQNGKFFDGRIELDGKVIFIDRNTEPDPELMRSLGYEEYTPPAPEPAPKRYSKLKIVRKLGDAWPAKKHQLEQAGLWDEFDQATFLDENDTAFAAVYATLTDEEKAALAECEYEE